MSDAGYEAVSRLCVCVCAWKSDLMLMGEKLLCLNAKYNLGKKKVQMGRYGYESSRYSYGLVLALKVSISPQG